MSEDAAPDLDQQARDILDRIRYVVLGTIDEDGRTRTSPVYFMPHGYEDLYWVSNPASHHSHNLERDNRLSGVVFDSTVVPGPDTGAVYVTGTAREVPADELEQHLPNAFDPGPGRPGVHGGGADRRRGPPAVGAARRELGRAHPRWPPDPRDRNGPAGAGRPAA